MCSVSNGKEMLCSLDRKERVRFVCFSLWFHYSLFTFELWFFRFVSFCVFERMKRFEQTMTFVFSLFSEEFPLKTREWKRKFSSIEESFSNERFKGIFRKFWGKTEEFPQKKWPNGEKDKRVFHVFVQSRFFPFIFLCFVKTFPNWNEKRKKREKNLSWFFCYCFEHLNLCYL